MNMRRTSMHGEWSSRWVFVLAATGSAVGLGNIWKFPYIAGENGGGAFVLIYLACIALIGIPIMMAEIMLGRRGRQSPINTMYSLGVEAGSSAHWKWLGWMGVVAGFLILSYYSVIAGWALDYIVKAVTGSFSGQTPEQIAQLFSGTLSNPLELIFWHTVFMCLTMVVVARGVKGGLEKAVRFLMPGLLILMFILLGYAISAGDFAKGLSFMFEPNFENLFYKHSEAGQFLTNAEGEQIFTLEYVLIAMGHAFFTLSLGMGAIMVYGSYLPRNASIAKTTFMVAGADTLVALLAGMIIFPIVFQYGLDPAKGPGLIFNTLPIAFGQMTGGVIIGTLFFILLTFAAWSSSISLIEPAVAFLVENKGIPRVRASVIMGVACWLVGLLSVFSFNSWSKFYPLNFSVFAGKTIFDVLDYLTANIMLPLGGLFIAIFAAWVMSRDASRDELGIGDGPAYKTWLFVISFITPPAVIFVFFDVIK